MCILGVAVGLVFASMASARVAYRVLWLLSSCTPEMAVRALLEVLLRWEPEAEVEDGQGSRINKLVLVLLVQALRLRRGGASEEKEEQLVIHSEGDQAELQFAGPEII